MAAMGFKGGQFMGYVIAAIAGGLVSFIITCIVAASSRRKAIEKSYQEGYEDGYIRSVPGTNCGGGVQ